MSQERGVTDILSRVTIQKTVQLKLAHCTYVPLQSVHDINHTVADYDDQ